MSADAINVTGAPLVEGKYLMYKDRPLVREGDTICYVIAEITASISLQCLK